MSIQRLFDRRVGVTNKLSSALEGIAGGVTLPDTPPDLTDNIYGFNDIRYLNAVWIIECDVWCIS
jgi:hypothetical protein